MDKASGFSDEDWAAYLAQVNGAAAAQTAPAPTMADYQAGYDPKTMSMEKATTSALNMNGANNAGFNAFRQQALRSGPSSWATAALDKTRLDTMGAMDKSNAAAAGQTAGARSMLAQSGGLDSGARERLARSGAKNALDMGQDIRRQGNSNALQVGMNDEQNKISQQGQLIGMEADRNKVGLQGKQFDMQQMINEKDKVNQYNLQKYNTQAGIYAGQQTAEATQQYSGGNWLCTEAGGDLSKLEWKLLSKLRRYAARKNRAATQFYIYGCKPLVDRMKAMNADWIANKNFVKRVVDLIAEDNLEAAYNLYFSHTKEMIAKYWPECDAPVYVGGI